MTDSSKLSEVEDSDVGVVILPLLACTLTQLLSKRVLLQLANSNSSLFSFFQPRHGNGFLLQTWILYHLSVPITLAKYYKYSPPQLSNSIITQHFDINIVLLPGILSCQNTLKFV